MRQKILLLIILIGNLDCFAQDLPRYGELLCDKMYWGYMGLWTPIGYEIDGPKILNGKTYGRLLMSGQHWGSRGFEAQSAFYSFDAPIGIRDEGGRIYVNKEEYLNLMTDDYYWSYVGDRDFIPYEATADGELVLYDFNKSVGDVYCKMHDGSELTVTKVDTLKTEDGVMRRRLTLSNGYDLIEGVGCTNSVGYLLFWLNPRADYSAGSENWHFLITFGIKGDDNSYDFHHILARDYNTAANETNGRHLKMMTPGRRWVYDYDNGEIKGTLTYSIDGDTLLHAYKRAKIKMTLVDNQTMRVVRSSYAGAFTERHDDFSFRVLQDGNLHYLAPGATEDKCLYPPKMWTGNYRTIDGIFRFVANDDEVTVGDETFCRYQLVNRKKNAELPRDKDSLYYWVDGIGSSKGLLEYSAGALMDSIRFVACYDGDECIFTRDDFYKDSSQPSKFVENLWFDSLLYEVRLGEKNAKLIHSDNYKTLNHAVIPSSVELWGENCLVSRIDKEAFKDATSVTSIDIPKSVVEIGESVFQNCTGLTSVDIPESVVSIGESAFSGCTSLTSVDIPEGVTNIGYRLFEGCTGLTSFVVPESVTTIESAAFYRCANLESVVLHPNLVSIGNNAFNGCKALTSIILPEGIKKVESRTFYDCSSLKEVSLPSSIDSLKSYSFAGCTSLENVYCMAQKVPFAPEVLTFYKSSYQDATLHVLAASLKRYKEEHPWCNFKYIVPIEEETDAIMVQKSEPDTHLLFDLQGRPVKDASKHGIYVKDGRKVIR